MYSFKLSDVLHNLSVSSNLTANTNIDRRRRKQLAFYLRNYHLIIAAFVTIILLLSTWDQLGITLFVFLVPYWTYVYALYVLKTRRSPYGDHRNPTALIIQTARSLLLWVATVILLVILFGRTDYLAGTIEGNLWLFFLLAVFVVGHHSGTVSTVIIVTLSCIIVFTLSFLFQTLSFWETMTNAAIKSAWLVLLSFMLYILLGAISDWETNSYLLNSVAKQLVDAGKIGRRKRDQL